nr:putative germin-like protein 2-1 [Ipomoea batatas]GMD72056.1 putative germin-like protein 2-1 [Ipomoea batatas]
MATGFLVTLSIVAFTCSVAYAYDPSPLQDFCVAVNDPQHAGCVRIRNLRRRMISSLLVWTLLGRRSSEFILVVQGTAYVGFVAVDPKNREKNRLFAKTLKAGDAFVIPQGLIHFMHNVGVGNATFFSAYNSQNPGVITIANEMFGTDPAISEDVLSKAFRIDKESVKHIQAKFSVS